MAVVLTVLALTTGMSSTFVQAANEVDSPLVKGTVAEDATGSFAIGDGSKVTSSYENSADAASVDSLAIGTNAEARNRKTVAVGSGAIARGDKSTAIGVGANTAKGSSEALAVGYVANASGNNAVALGNRSIASEDNTVSVGVSKEDATNSSPAMTRRIVNVSDGIKDSDAATVGQIKTMTGMDSEKGNVVQYDGEDKSVVTFVGENGTKLTNLAAGEFKDGSTDAVTAGQLYDAGIVPGKAADGSVAIGNDSTVTSGAWDWDTNTPLPANGVAIGDNAKVNNSAVNGVAIGQGAEVRTDNATAIGQGSRVVSGDGSVALGQGSMVTATDAKSSDPHGVVSVGLTGNKETEGFTRRIINVADGTSDSDAATYGQVKDVDAKIGDLDFSNTHSLKKAENVTDALTKLDTKAYNLSGKIDDFSPFRHYGRRYT